MPCGSSSHAIKVIRMPQNTHLCIAELKTITSDSNGVIAWVNGSAVRESFEQL